MTRLVIFDVDGVLLDSTQQYADAFAKALAPFGIEFTREMLDSYHRDSKKQNAQWKIAEWMMPGKSEEEMRRVVATVEGLMTTNWKKLTPTPNAVHAIEMLRNRGIRIAIATNANKAYAMNALAYFGFNGFDAVVTREDGFFEKSDALASIIKRLNVSGEETIYVGDTVADGVAAKKAKCGFIGFALWSNQKELMEKDGAAAVESMDELASEILSE